SYNASEKTRQLKRLESVNRSPVYSHFGETIQGVASIRAYGKMPQFCLDLEERVDRLMKCNTSTSFRIFGSQCAWNFSEILLYSSPHCSLSSRRSDTGESQRGSSAFRSPTQSLSRMSSISWFVNCRCSMRM
ncbi:hypothetical protein PMAYCL1PPCAC_11446, partial [Pristionchus mayeri]